MPNRTILNMNRRRLGVVTIAVSLCLVFLGIRLPSLPHSHYHSPKPRPRAVLQTGKKSAQQIVSQSTESTEDFRTAPSLRLPAPFRTFRPDQPVCDGAANFSLVFTRGPPVFPV